MKRLLLLISVAFLISNGLAINPIPGYAVDRVESTKPQQKETGNVRVESVHKAIFHLDWDQDEKLNLALENIKNLFKEVPAQQCQISVVANGKAVNLFKKDKVSTHVETIEDLHKLGVRFKMCRNALANNHIQKQDLIEVCEIVPAGILEIIDLQQQGFAYVKP